MGRELRYGPPDRGKQAAGQAEAVRKMAEGNAREEVRRIREVVRAARAFRDLKRDGLMDIDVKSTLVREGYAALDEALRDLDGVASK